VGVEQRCGECVGALRVCERSVLLLSQALCRITRQSPTAFQNVIEKVGLNAVISSLASAICKVQQYMLTLFTAMLSCGIHLQRLIQEKVGLFLLEWCMLHRMPSLQAQAGLLTLSASQMYHRAFPGRCQELLLKTSTSMWLLLSPGNEEK
jgi:hypothetical protein